jgi:hypothetical protein
VEEEGETPALLLLGCHDEVGHPRPLGLPLLRLGDRLLSPAPLALDEVHAERAGRDDRGGQPSERDSLEVEGEPEHADQRGRGQRDHQHDRANR